MPYVNINLSKTKRTFQTALNQLNTTKTILIYNLT